MSRLTPEAAQEAAQNLRAARYVIAAGVVAGLHAGELPPALPVLREVLGISLLQAGFLLSLVQLAGMALGLFSGLTAQRIGLKRSMVAGLLILAGASALGGTAQSAAECRLAADDARAGRVGVFMERVACTRPGAQAGAA